MTFENIVSNARSRLGLLQRDFHELSLRHIETITQQIVALCNEQQYDFVSEPKPHFIDPSFHYHDKTVTNAATLAIIELVDWCNVFYGSGTLGTASYIPRFPRKNYRHSTKQWEDSPPPPREPHFHPCR